MKNRYCHLTLHTIIKLGEFTEVLAKEPKQIEISWLMKEIDVAECIAKYTDSNGDWFVDFEMQDAYDTDFIKNSGNRYGVFRFIIKIKLPPNEPNLYDVFKQIPEVGHNFSGVWYKRKLFFQEEFYNQTLILNRTTQTKTDKDDIVVNVVRGECSIEYFDNSYLKEVEKYRNGTYIRGKYTDGFNLDTKLVDMTQEYMINFSLMQKLDNAYGKIMLEYKMDRIDGILEMALKEFRKTTKEDPRGITQYLLVLNKKILDGGRDYLLEK